MCDNCNSHVPTTKHLIEGSVFNFCGEKCNQEFRQNYYSMVDRLVEEISSWKSYKRNERSYA